ncbi:conserved hypothetical protein, partial [Ricinus communis]
MVPAQAGDQRPALIEGQLVLGEHGVGAGAGPVARQVGRRRLVVAGQEDEGVDHRATAVGRVARVQEVDAVHVEAHQHLVLHAEQFMAEGGVGAVADLLLVVADLEVVAARHAARGGIEGIGLAVAPVALAREPVELVVHGDGIAGRPQRVEAGPLVVVLELGVVDVVVLAQGPAVEAPVDQRHALVALRRLAALVVRQGELQLGRDVQPQRTTDGQALALAARHEAVGGAVADVEAVRKLVVDRAAAAEGGLARGVGA